MEYEIRGCGDSFRRPEGNFSSPNYPSVYKGDKQCHWDITVNFGNLIELTIHDLDLEESVNCLLDGISVSSIENDTNVNNQYCGRQTKLPKIITSNSNKMFVKFYSDPYYSGRGFFASYKAVPISKCAIPINFVCVLEII